MTLEQQPVSQGEQRAPSAAHAAAAFIITGFVLVALFVRALIGAFQTQALDDFTRDLYESLTTKVTLLDYVVGALFAMSWMCTRQTSKVLQLPHYVWALLLLPLGNPVLYLYVLVSVWRERNVRGAIVPLSGHIPAPIAGDGERGGKVKTFAWLYGTVFAVLGAAYFAVLVYAVATENVVAMFRKYFWAGSLWRATFYDVQLGILFCFVLISLREGLVERRAFSTVMWLLALVLLGQGTACLYAVTVAWDALVWNVSIGEAFALSKVDQTSSYF
jgi:hypothetical protein